MSKKANIIIRWWDKIAVKRHNKKANNDTIIYADKY